MGVTLEHPQLLVAADRRDLSDVEALLEQTADALVPEIVKAEIVHLSPDPKMLESETDRVAGDREYSIGVALLVSS